MLKKQSTIILNVFVNKDCFGVQMKLPKRKPNRLEGYDYNSTGAYFITICTKNRKEMFWDNVGASIARPQEIKLSKYGKMVDDAINNISAQYPAVSVDKYVIMPNHIHLLLRICCDNNGRPMVAPTVSNVIQQTKGYVTKQIGLPIWQKSFHDHIIRNENDYRETWEYIDQNPLKWEDDELFSKK